MASPGVGSLSRTKVAPFSSIALPSAKAATRSFGPCRSTSTAIGRLNSRSIVRMTSIFSGSFSRGRWLMLSRNTSAPARKSVSIISGVSEAGPRVATILVRRERFNPASNLCERAHPVRPAERRRAATSTATATASSMSRVGGRRESAAAEPRPRHPGRSRHRPCSRFVRAEGAWSERLADPVHAVGRGSERNREDPVTSLRPRGSQTPLR